MASRRRGKGRRKVGRKSAGCAVGFATARNDAFGTACNIETACPHRFDSRSAAPRASLERSRLT